MLLPLRETASGGCSIEPKAGGIRGNGLEVGGSVMVLVFGLWMVPGLSRLRQALPPHGGSPTPADGASEFDIVDTLRASANDSVGSTPLHVIRIPRRPQVLFPRRVD